MCAHVHVCVHVCVCECVCMCVCVGTASKSHGRLPVEVQKWLRRQEYAVRVLLEIGPSRLDAKPKAPPQCAWLVVRSKHHGLADELMRAAPLSRERMSNT